MDIRSWSSVQSPESLEDMHTGRDIRHMSMQSSRSMPSELFLDQVRHFTDVYQSCKLQSLYYQCCSQEDDDTSHQRARSKEYTAKPAQHT